MNGVELDPVALIEILNEVGARNAIGRIDLVENRFVGIKSRGVYEAPGMELLGTAYSYLLQLVLDRRSRELRLLSILLVSVLVLGALWATAVLIYDLVHGGSETNSASDLLEAGAVVWTSNNIAFALLYWELDGGGAAARAHHLPRYADLAFPQQLNPELGGTQWRPRFIDYLYLGLTDSLAFSPTDVMPLVPWAKITMAVQSLISLAVLGLIIARAINVLPG